MLAVRSGDKVETMSLVLNVMSQGRFETSMR